MAKPIPFNFILDYLYPIDVVTRPMFSVIAVYTGNKIVLGLRESLKNPESNGIWIATSKEHHGSLKKDFPTIASIPVLGDGATGWQYLPSDAEHFEEDAIKICELIKKNDPRIGKVPNSKKPSRAKNN